MNFIMEEILEEILQYLPSNQLHNAMHVSKRWCETIFLSSRLEMNMILDIYCDKTSEALEKSKLFSYKTINLTADETTYNRPSSSPPIITKFDADVREIFKILGPELEILKINNFCRILPMLLLKASNLTSLNLDGVDAVQNRDINEADTDLQVHPRFFMYGYHIKRPVEPIRRPPIRQRFNTFNLNSPQLPSRNFSILTLKNLKVLEIKMVRRVLYWIETPNLKTFIVHDALNCNGIGEILLTTAKLENLVIDRFVAAHFKNHEKFTFKLRKLQINCIKNSQLTNQNERFVANFIRFLKSQKQSLQDLSLTFHTVHRDIITIISSINDHLALTNFSIIFNLENPNDIFTSVNIDSGFISVLKKFQNIISHCEHVTSLDMNFNMYVETEALDHLAAFMPKLKNLSIHPFFTKVSSSTVFENLESLTITKLREGPHTATWYEIAMTCPNIKELTLVDEVFEISPMKLKMVLENAKKLKVLKLAGSHRFVISEEFLKVLTDDNIKVCRINVHAKMNQEEFYEKMRILTENSKIQTVLHPI